MSHLRTASDMLPGEGLVGRSGPYDRILRVSVDPALVTGRWTASRKFWLVGAIDYGAITVPAACARYGLSEAEIEEWRRRVAAHGLAGLKTTKLQVVR